MSSKFKILIGILILVAISAGIFFWFNKEKITPKADATATNPLPSGVNSWKIYIGTSPNGSAKVYPAPTGAQFTNKGIVYDTVLYPLDFGQRGMMVTVVPTEGYEFVGWNGPQSLSRCYIKNMPAGGGGSYRGYFNPATFMINSDKCMYTAVMQKTDKAFPEINTMKIMASPSIGGTVYPHEIKAAKNIVPAGADWVKENTTIESWPNQGYKFVNWTTSGGCSLQGLAFPATNKINLVDWIKSTGLLGDCNVIANFAGPTLSLTATYVGGQVYVDGTQATQNPTVFNSAYGQVYKLKAVPVTEGIWNGWTTSNPTQCKFGGPNIINNGASDTDQETTFQVFGTCDVYASMPPPRDPAL